MSDAVTLIHSRALSGHAGYAHAAVVAADTQLVFLAGSCPVDLEGVTVGIGDVKAQTAKCLDNMKLALLAAGASIEDVVSTRVSVASDERDALAAVWDVVRAAFGNHGVPSTLVGVTVLGYPDQLVEIEAVAALVSGRSPAAVA